MHRLAARCPWTALLLSLIALGLGCSAPPNRLASFRPPLASAVDDVAIAATAPASVTTADWSPVVPGSLGMIAYLQNGALWVQALPNGPAQELSPQAGGTLRSSPSGSWLLAGETLYNVNDGSQRSATGCVAWSPVEDKLVCIEPDPGIAVESADGSRQTLISVSGLAGPPGSPLWSPDGSELAYVVNGPLDTSQEPYSRTSSLWAVDADGSDARMLFSDDAYAPDGGLIELTAWSPDEATILFQLDPFASASLAMDGLPLYAVSTSGGTPVSLNTTVLVDSNEFSGGFSPAGVFAVAAGEDRQTWTNKRIALLDPAGGTRTDLTRADTAALAPAWSSDGSRIAYVAAPDTRPVPGGDAARAEMAQRHIWIMNADGSDQYQLTSDPSYRDERPFWSADGSQILFARLDNATDTASLWLVPAAGGQPVNIADIADGQSTPPSLSDPLWFSTFGAVPWDTLFAWWQPPQS